MSEVEALSKIADAINTLAAAVSGLGTAAWFTLLFKSQSPNSSITKLTSVLEKWIEADIRRAKQPPAAAGK